MDFLRMVSFAVFFTSSSWLHASEPLPLQSGLWEITTQADLKGIPSAPMPKIDRVCLRPSDIETGKIALRTAATCKVTGGAWSDRRLTLNVSCPDAPPDAQIQARLESAGKSFTSFIELNPNVRYSHDGKWLAADCP